MNQSIQPKYFTTFLISAAAAVCFGLLPTAQAVVPAPDGGYPGFNTAEGQNTLFSLTTGVANTGVGWYSLFSNTDGSLNTAVGAGTLLFNIGDQIAFEGVENTAVGSAALIFNATGWGNTATGAGALSANTTGILNTATGHRALPSNTTGIRNTAVGSSALFANTTGSNNTALGVGAGQSVTTADHVICIGSLVFGANVSHSCYIGEIFGATSSGGTAVFINSDGKLGTATSSRRFKEEIKPMKRTSEALFSLKPVTFHYKKEIDPAGISQFGLVAEDVEKVNPDLVVRDKEGKPYTVRYEAVNAMLLNEFLKEHNTVQEQGATIARLQKQIEAITADLQRVSAQLEVSGPAPQVVSNDQ